MTPTRWLKRFGPVVMTLLLGTTVTLGIYSVVEHHQTESRAQRFHQQAENVAAAVREKLAVNTEILYSVSDFFAASSDVTRRDFHVFTKGQLSRQSGIQAIEWVPRVLAADRARFEAAARQSGLVGFRFTESDARGNMVPAPPRAEYYPVYYIEPMAGNERALGFAPAMAERDAAIEQAVSSGQAVVTGRFRLIQEPGRQYGLAIFVPVYRTAAVPATAEARRAALVGLVEGVFRLNDMMQAAVEGLDLSGLSVTLLDRSAPEDAQLLASSTGPDGPSESRDGLEWEQAFSMGGRDWLINCQSTDPVTDPLAAPWLFLLGGFVWTGLAAAYQYNLMDRRAQIEQQVELRTAELSHATQELRRSESTLSAIITHATDAIFIKDLAGRYLLVNPEVVRLLERPMDAIIGATDDDLFPPEIAAFNREKDQHVLEQGQAQTHLETIWTPGDGRRDYLTTKFPYLSATGETIGIIGMARDITPLQQAETALREERDRAQRYLDVAGAMIVLIDPKGRLALANRMAGEILGRDPAELVGMDWFASVLPDREREATRAEFARLLARDAETISRAEHPIRTLSGEERRIVWHNVTLHDPQGRLVGLLCSGTDVTDYKHAIEEVAHREAELAQAREIDRLKSNFVSSISHDLRTPLTSIKGYAEFLEDGIGGELSDEQREFVAQIERGARRLENLVDDLLDFARFDAGTFTLRCEPTDLGSMLSEVAQSMQPQCEENRLQLKVSLPPEPLVGSFDQKRIERVLANLVSNAVKFTPAGGSICLEAERVGQELRCAVIDSGPGIEPDDQPRLFQRFSQLATGLHKGGTGLGLSISKSIIEAHGGQIGVSSRPGEGATFWFTLPAEPSPLVGVEETQDAPDHTHAGQ